MVNDSRTMQTAAASHALVMHAAKTISDAGAAAALDGATDPRWYRRPTRSRPRVAVGPPSPV